MSRKLALGLLAAVGTLVVLTIATAGLYWASQRMPGFYLEALAQHPDLQRHASDAMLRQTAALASDIRRRNRWQALFTADEINGWLAVDATKNHARLFPPDIQQPRVAIENDRLKVAFRWERAWWSAIVSLETEVFLRETNVVAVRIRSARAGNLPLPLGDLLTDLVASGEQLGFHIDHGQLDEDPLLVITVPDGKDRPLGLESLELRQGEVYLAGGRAPKETPPLASRPTRIEAAGTDQTHSENANTQR